MPQLGLLLCRQSGFSGLLALLMDLLPQPLQFLGKFLAGRLGVRGWHEGAGLEIRLIPKSTVKPDSQLTSDPQMMQSVPLSRLLRLVNRDVPRLSDAVKQLRHFAVKNAAFVKSVQQPELILLGIDVNPRPSRRILGQQLRELPQLNQADIRVVENVPLRLGRNLKHQLTVLTQEAKIGRGCRFGAHAVARQVRN